MSGTPITPSSNSLMIFKNILYILALVVMIAGMLAGASLMTAADNLVANFIMPLQLLGVELINNILSPILTGFLINLGVVILVISVIMSVLFFALGRLIAHIALLETRLTRLEAKS